MWGADDQLDVKCPARLPFAEYTRCSAKLNPMTYLDLQHLIDYNYWARDLPRGVRHNL